MSIYANLIRSSIYLEKKNLQLFPEVYCFNALQVSTEKFIKI